MNKVLSHPDLLCNIARYTDTIRDVKALVIASRCAGLPAGDEDAIYTAGYKAHVGLLECVLPKPWAPVLGLGGPKKCEELKSWMVAFEAERASVKVQALFEEHKPIMPSRGIDGLKTLHQFDSKHADCLRKAFGVILFAKGTLLNHVFMTRTGIPVADGEYKKLPSQIYNYLSVLSHFDTGSMFFLSKIIGDLSLCGSFLQNESAAIWPKEYTINYWPEWVDLCRKGEPFALVPRTVMQAVLSKIDLVTQISQHLTSIRDIQALAITARYAGMTADDDAYVYASAHGEAGRRISFMLESLSSPVAAGLRSPNATPSKAVLGRLNALTWEKKPSLPQENSVSLWAPNKARTLLIELNNLREINPAHGIFQSQGLSKINMVDDVRKFFSKYHNAHEYDDARLKHCLHEFYYLGCLVGGLGFDLFDDRTGTMLECLRPMFSDLRDVLSKKMPDVYSKGSRNDWDDLIKHGKLIEITVKKP